MQSKNKNGLTHIEFEVSSDNVNFEKVADIETDIDPTDMESEIRDYVQTISPVKSRYVRVHAYNLGKIDMKKEIGERLSKKLALPIFSSDAISSSAYATDEILRASITMRSPSSRRKTASSSPHSGL